MNYELCSRPYPPKGGSLPLGRFRGGRIMSYAPALTLLWEEVSPWGDLEGVLLINITLPLRRMEWRCLMERQ